MVIVEEFNPLVSIIIPVFNGSNYVKEAIDSALGQTYENIEILVVNDGSKDDGKTEEIAKSYKGRIRYFYKENGGVATALNMGIDNMRGEYFSWLSHDDVYYPIKVETQVEFLRKYNRKDLISYSDLDIINSSSNKVSSIKLENVSPENFRYAITLSSFVHGCSLLIPKECFDKWGVFDPKLRTTQDYDLWFRIAGDYEFYGISVPLIQSRYHEEQDSLALKSLATTEVDTLKDGFINKLTTEEIVRGSGRSLVTSYFDFLKIFSKRYLIKASKSCLRLILKNRKSESFIYFINITVMSFYFLITRSLLRWLKLLILP